MRREGILMPQLLATLLPLVAMFAIMYFLLILPEKKRTKKYNSMLSELKVNDEVLTRGGIIGKIITIEEDQMVIQSGPDRVRFRVTKNSIAQKLNKDVA
jgi:preprotein translocase subunit YajC